MVRKSLLAATAVLLMAGIGSADAAAKKPAQPKPVCQQVLDPSGDSQPGSGLNPAKAPQAPSLDVISADIASGPSKLVAVIRVASLDADPATSFGSQYQFSWQVNGVKQALSYRTYADAAPDAVFDADLESGTLLDLIPASVAVDPSTKQIAISVLRQRNPQLKKSTSKTPAKFSNFKVNTYAGVARKSGQTYSGFDNTDDSSRTYLDTAPTCVKGT